jgi:alpha-glucoside transport system substrate-binding protein
MLANVKGYVWYSPAKFKEWGVEVRRRGTSCSR